MIDPPRLAPERNPVLHELRGLAAVLVVIYHASNAFRIPHYLGTSFEYCGGFFRPGESAVDFFFVLSGFLMVRVHRSEAGQPACRARFYRKRFQRIYPPYWAAIAGLAVLFLLRPRLHGDPAEFSPSKVVATILLLPQATQLWIPPAWSLTSEVFFYLIFGVVFFAGRGVFLAFALTWLAAILAVMAGGPAQRVLAGNAWLDLAFSPRNYGFLAGCLAGYFLDRLPPRGRAPLFWVGLAGFAATWGVDLVREDRAALSVLYASASTLIVAGATAVDLRGRDLLLALGDASYSIYITHWTGLAITAGIATRAHLVERFGLFAMATNCIVATLAGGVACHFLVERPVLATARRLMQPAAGARPEGPGRVARGVIPGFPRARA